MNKKKSSDKLLKGRLDQKITKLAEKFNASVSFDKKLALYDIQGSIAHCTMLMEQKIISDTDSTTIIAGLLKIQNQIQEGTFEWHNHLEDVHMNIEFALIEQIGDVGGKLHTARSRNDQVATDLRLYARTENTRIQQYIDQCQKQLLDLAEEYYDTIMPGFTHLQIAQPITFGHHLLAWFHMLDRDKGRLIDCYRRINKSPLGSAALAGTTYPINPERTADLLGFSAICGNSLDAVSDRDFVLEMLNTLALMMNHLSRIAEELIIWNSSPFSMIDLADEYCTGSSIMPQKKNPDILELIRGKSARVFAASNSIFMLMKGQPLAYNKDNQEDKEPLFDAVETTSDSLQILTALLKNTKPNKDSMYKLASHGYSTATDIADYLVKKDIPFRESYRIVGEIVRLAVDKKCSLVELSLEEFQHINSKISKDIYQVITLEECVNARNHSGGTAPKQVLKSCQSLRKTLISD